MIGDYPSNMWGFYPPLYPMYPWWTWPSCETGWVCPICRRVYAPSMMMCSYCPPNTTTATGTNVTITWNPDNLSPSTTGSSPPINGNTETR